MVQAKRSFGRWLCAATLLGSVAALAQEGPVHGPAMPPNPLPYDLLLRNGHVLDDRNHIDMSGDVGVKDGKLVAVGPHLKPQDALKTVDVAGYYITPGLIDLHTHVYAGTGEKGSYAGDLSVYPDGFTLRNGVTTIVDAGSSGWRSFDDFKDRIIDRSRTRVLAELNIVGAGMRGARYEDNLDDMDGKATGEKAKQFPGVIVGIKSAHFTGPEWKPYDQAQIAEDISHLPVMIDFGANRIERPLYQLVTEHMRTGDIYTHCFSGLRNEQDAKTGGPSRALLEMRKRGIYCDVGHGGGSFSWTVATPIVRGGYHPDSISTDLHVGSMNNGMKDLLNVADKMLALGETVPEVVAQMTSHPAHEIRQEQYGNLSVGGIADIAVLSVEHGRFGFVDMYNTKMLGSQKLVCQMTVKDGKIVYDLNGLSSDMWNATEHSADERQAKRWTVFSERSFGVTRGQQFPTSTPVNAPPQVQDKAMPKP